MRAAGSLGRVSASRIELAKAHVEPLAPGVKPLAYIFFNRRELLEEPFGVVGGSMCRMNHDSTVDFFRYQVIIRTFSFCKGSII